MTRTVPGVLAGLIAAPCLLTTALATAALADDDRTDEAVERGRNLLADVGQAYKDAGGMHDTVTMNINSPMGEQSDHFTLRIGEGTDAEVEVQGYRIVSLDDRFYVEREGLDDKYLEAELHGNLLQTMERVFGAADLPMPHLGLRYAETDDDRIDAMSMGVVENIRLVGHRTGEHEGQSADVLLFEGNDGSLNVHVVDNLIQLIEFDLTPAGMPEEFAMDGTLTMEPRVVSELDEPIRFATDNREAVERMEELQPTPVAVGDAAPDFELQDLDGRTVKLSDLRGEVVVLDFWATWCQPCIVALPKVDEFAQWAEENDYPVRVYAINVWEDHAADERRDHVASFWNEQGFSFPTLLDTDDSVVMEYGVRGIPTSVVIGPDGTVTDVTAGAATLEALQEKAREAMDRSS